MTPLAERDARAFLAQAGSSPVERAYRAVNGAWAEDDAGHRFLDFAGNTCHNIGYAHPRLVAALKDQLDALPFTPRGFTSEPAVALAEKLTALWPYGPAKALLGVSGADAIEMAMKLAYVATGRKGALAFEESWHGAAIGALLVGGPAAQRPDFPALEGCAQVAPYWPKRNDQPADPGRALDQIAAHLATREIAFLLAEPIRTPAHLPPEGFWPEIRRLCDAAGTLLIFDEIPSGLGKTGRFFASEHVGVAPDMTVLGKSLGGGALPLSALIARADLDVSGHIAIGHYTHQKNPLLARAGLETLAILQEDGLVGRAERIGAELRARLAPLCGAGGPYRGLRGLGALTVLETGPETDAKALSRAVFEAGLLTSPAQGDGLALSPPLTIGEEEIAAAIAALGAARDNDR